MFLLTMWFGFYILFIISLFDLILVFKKKNTTKTKQNTKQNQKKKRKITKTKARDLKKHKNQIDMRRSHPLLSFPWNKLHKLHNWRNKTSLSRSLSLFFFFFFFFFFFKRGSSSTSCKKTCSRFEEKSFFFFFLFFFW